MKKLDGVGKEHEEFKLRLDAQKALELARIQIQKEVAAAQAMVIAEALKAAHIEIIGGEQEFFDRITRSVVNARSVDKLFDHSEALSELKHSLLHAPGEGGLPARLRAFFSQFKVSAEDLRNLTLSALLIRMLGQTKDPAQKTLIQQLQGVVEALGIGGETPESAGIV
jgi:hypothetical protein